MSKGFEPNKDWIKREQGRIPTKGAMAAERASAGLGTTGDGERLAQPLPPPALRKPKPISP